MRRIYFLSPDIDIAKRVVNGLLLAKIENRHIHTIAEHAEMAKTHANAAKNEKNLTATGGTHLDAGIRSLDQAIENGKLGAADSARKAAEDAVTHLKEASK